jgi:hypothetical protein
LLPGWCDKPRLANGGAGVFGLPPGWLWVIAENLHRADLTALERSEHIAEWVKLTGEKAKAQVAPSGHTGGRENKGINAAVRELGIDRTDAQRSIKVANLSPEAKDAAPDPGVFSCCFHTL